MALPEWFRAAAKRTAVIGVTLLAFGYFTAEPYASFAGMGVVLAVVAAFEVLEDHTDVALPPGAKGLAFGLMAVAVSVAWTALDGFDPSLGVLAAFGAWALFDGVQRYRRTDAYPDRGGEWDDLDAGESMLRMQVTGTVGRALLDEPRTPEELAADLDLTRTRVDRTLAFMTDGGYAYEANGVYYADENQFGGVAFVRRTLGGAVRRFLRPFRA